MNVFSVNQATQVYYTTTNSLGKQSTLGTLSSYVDKTVGNKQFYFVFKDALGNVSRSDLISVDNILSAQVTKGVNLKKKLTRINISSSNGFDNGNGIVGQSYLVRVRVNNFIGMSPADSQFVTFGVAAGGFTKANTIKYLAISLAKNAKRPNSTELFNVYVGAANVTTLQGLTKVEASMDISQLSGTPAAIYLTEADPDYQLGIKQQRLMTLDVEVRPIEKGGMEVEDWAVVETAGYLPIEGSAWKVAADLEYFHHGERGDQYRMVGWPDYIPTTYSVNPNASGNPYYVQIHYAYVGPNEGSQKSEKDILIITDTDAHAEVLATNIGSITKLGIDMFTQMGTLTESYVALGTATSSNG